MTSRTNMFHHTAVAALAALATCSIGVTAFGAVRGTGATKIGEAPITEGEATVVPLVEEVFEGEGGSNANDVYVPFEPATTIGAPNGEHFAIRASLSASDTGATCRDVDYMNIEGLVPLCDYGMVLSGEVGDGIIVGWFDKAGNQIFSETGGEIYLVANILGEVLLGLSSLDDADFDGLDDVTALPHDLCGEYSITVIAIGVHNELTGDVNRDDLVDINDVRAMLNLIGAADAPQADLTHDGIVDAQDLRILADIVTDKRARKLATKKAKKIEKRAAKAARKAAKQAAKEAARRGEIEGEELKALIAENAEVLSETAPSAEPQASRRRR